MIVLEDIIYLRRTKKMTLLRRIAQLVEDLHTIGAISKEDKISTRDGGSKFCDTNCITLTIEYERGDSQANRRTKQLIGGCILEEFSENEYKIVEYSEELDNEIAVVLFRKP